MTDRTFRTKVVHAFDRDVAVVLQDANGPCPLLAIVNVLVLSGRLELRPVCGRVEQAVLLSQVAAVALESGYGRAGAEESADRAHNLADVVACLPLLATGLDVNVRFADAESYEATAQTAVFDALSVRLLHGFMAQDAPAPSFNQVLERAQTSEVAAVREEAGAFLRRSASSLTEAGLAALARTLDGTLGVILLGTHFAAATARGGVVYALVTDVGYAGAARRGRAHAPGRRRRRPRPDLTPPPRPPLPPPPQACRRWCGSGWR